MTETVFSKNDIPIRLTDERWTHIIEEYDELAEMRVEVLETVADPSQIFAGNQGELLAVRDMTLVPHAGICTASSTPHPNRSAEALV